MSCRKPPAGNRGEDEVDPKYQIVTVTNDRKPRSELVNSVAMSEKHLKLLSCHGSRRRDLTPSSMLGEEEEPNIPSKPSVFDRKK